MERIAKIGSSIAIKGEITAQEDVVIAGRVEGTINVEGHLVVVEACGHVEADIVARGIIVSGTVKGSLVAEERIELRNSAEVEGELTSPRINMAEGAQLRGRVDMPRTEKVKLAVAS
jgi:cytoskeletal protein CcmA (bactofilin family)